MWDKHNMPLATKDKNWNKSQKKTFIEIANSTLINSDNEIEAITAGINAVEKLENATQETTAEFKRVPFIEPGVVRYGDRVFFVKKQTLDTIVNSMRGKPITIEHPGNVDAEKTHGYVHSVLYNNEDGQYYAEFLIHTKEGKEASKELKFGSCVYNPVFTGKGGVHNGQPYDDEIIGGSMTSLALTASPRYENAKILNNSIKENSMTAEEKTGWEKCLEKIAELTNAIKPSAKKVEELKNEQELLNFAEEKAAKKKVKKALKASKGKEDEEFLKNCSGLEKKAYKKKLKKMAKKEALKASLQNSLVVENAQKKAFEELSNSAKTGVYKEPETKNDYTSIDHQVNLAKQYKI
jgi:hypothetical protein